MSYLDETPVVVKMRKIWEIRPYPGQVYYNSALINRLLLAQKACICILIVFSQFGRNKFFLFFSFLVNDCVELMFKNIKSYGERRK